VLGSGLEAEREIQLAQERIANLDGLDLSEYFITAGVKLTPYELGPVVTVSRTADHKCGRCWRHLPEVTEDGALCSRCEQVVAGMDAPA
jgi:isoleucyl-tRNA synthetase